MAQNDEGNTVDPVTKEDLDKALDRHLDRVKEILEPIKKEQDEHKTILIGASRVNGLVGKVKTLGVNLKVIYGLLAFLGGVMFKKYLL